MDFQDLAARTAARMTQMLAGYELAGTPEVDPAPGGGATITTRLRWEDDPSVVATHTARYGPDGGALGCQMT